MAAVTSMSIDNHTSGKSGDLILNSTSYTFTNQQLRTLSSLVAQLNVNATT